MDEKVMSADSNVELLKADIKEKYGQLEILKLEIDELNYEIGLYGETESLAKELAEKTKEFENLKNEYDKLFEELGTYDYEDLIEELELAEYDAERLREAMEGSSIESTRVDSTETIEKFINSEYTPIKFIEYSDDKSEKKKRQNL
jgi:molecular chaperone GrpE (heat shock protein)